LSDGSIAPIRTRSSSALLFTACRYLVYALLFARGMLAAKFLGPHLLGIFGFLTLMMQYAAYSSLGIQYAVNVKLSITPESENSPVISNALSLTALIGLLTLAVGVAIQAFHLHVFDKYSFQQYAIIVAAITATTVLQQVFTNIYRAYNQLSKIAIAEMLNAVLLLILTISYRGEALIKAVLVGLCVSAVLANIVFLYRAPFKISLGLDRARALNLLAVGIPLLIYNISFYLIMMAAQSVISIYYSIEAMGYYTLSSSIANAVLLGFNSIAWIAYPGILARTHAGISDVGATRTTDRANVVFGTGVFLVVFMAILFMPILFHVLPAYQRASGTVVILLLSQAVIATCMGYNCLAIARNKELQVAGISMFSVIVVTSFAVLAGVRHVDFVWVAVSVLGGSIVYSVLQARLGASLLHDKSALRSVLPIGTLASIALCVAGTVSRHPIIGALLGLVAFILGNIGRLRELFEFALHYLRGLSWNNKPLFQTKS
jgi:O-antigen/teichoic acid export membrane protein